MGMFDTLTHNGLEWQTKSVVSDASLLARTILPFDHTSPFGGSRAAYLKAATGCHSPKTSSF